MLINTRFNRKTGDCVEWCDCSRASIKNSKNGLLSCMPAHRARYDIFRHSEHKYWYSGLILVAFINVLSHSWIWYFLIRIRKLFWLHSLTLGLIYLALMHFDFLTKLGVCMLQTYEDLDVNFGICRARMTCLGPWWTCCHWCQTSSKTTRSLCYNTFHYSTTNDSPSTKSLLKEENTDMSKKNHLYNMMRRQYLYLTSGRFHSYHQVDYSRDHRGDSL